MNRTKRSMIDVGSLTLACALLLAAANATAEEPDSDRAQVLFEQGRELIAAGNYAVACPKFEESQRLDPGSGTLINLGDCYERVGRVASAWSTFMEAAKASAESGNSEREAVARSRAEAIAPRVPKLALSISGADSSGLQIQRDGVGLGPADLAAALPIDPGEHIIQASQPGRRPWQTTVTISADGNTVTVNVPELPRDAAKLVTVPPPAAPSAGFGTQRTLALAAGGLGVVGIAVGTVFGLKSKDKHDESFKHCPVDPCLSESGVDAMTAARKAGNISTAAFIVGGVGLAGGAALWFTAKDFETPGAEIALGFGSLRVRGTW